MRVLVLAAPGMHLGYVGCYGCDWVRTPHLDRLASEGIVFDQHYADTPLPRSQFRGLSDTEPNRSWWTGRYFFPADAEPPGTKAPSGLLSLLESHGVGTVRITARSRIHTVAASPSLSFPRTRLLTALDDSARRSPLLVWVDLPSLAPPWPLLREKRFRPYFPREAEEEPLTPWPNPPHGAVDFAKDAALERLQATYAAVLTYFDAQLGKLFEELRARNWYDDFLLIVTADRGLALGEHGFIGAVALALHEEMIHIPLVMRLPGGAEAGRRVSALTQSVDIHPTLLEALGLPPSEAHGRSLWPLARGEVESLRPFICAGLAGESGVAYALRTPEWSLVIPAQTNSDATPHPPQLYKKPDDRWEVNDVLQHHQEPAHHMEETLRRFVKATHQHGPFQPPELSFHPGGQ